MFMSFVVVRDWRYSCLGWRNVQAGCEVFVWTEALSGVELGLVRLCLCNLPSLTRLPQCPRFLPALTSQSRRR